MDLHRSQHLLLRSVAAVAVLVGALPAAAWYTTNLVRNSGFEYFVGEPNAAVDFDHWDEAFGGPHNDRYQDYPMDFGPSDRYPGPNRYYAFGGFDVHSRLVQNVDVSGYTTFFNNINITFILSGYLGGYRNQEDHAVLTIEFLDQLGNVLLTKALRGPTMAQRNFQTGMMYREATGKVPKQSYTARITLDMLRTEGFANNGCADQLSLILHYSEGIRIGKGGG